LGKYKYRVQTIAITNSQQPSNRISILLNLNHIMMTGFYTNLQDHYPPPLLYPSVYVAATYPEHHLPLYHARHGLTHALHEALAGEDTNVQSPRIDIRETPEKYYIDIELPGLRSTSDLTIKWTNPSVIVVRGAINRNRTLEEESAIKAASTGYLNEKENGKNASAKKNAQENQKEEDNHHIHFLRQERRIGSFMRVFNFATDVDHDTLNATLRYGLLSIVVSKKPHVDMRNKHIKVEVDDAEPPAK
jgi:HSP20 family molecular chaperone IbpA